MPTVLTEKTFFFAAHQLPDSDWEGDEGDIESSVALKNLLSL